MKVTKTYQITSEYQAVVEVENNDLILYIEKLKKVFFGLIEWNERVTSFKVFTMGDHDDDRGIEIQRMIHGYLGRYGLNIRNIDTFDIEVEICKIYHEYLVRKEAEKKRYEKLNAFVNNL